MEPVRPACRRRWWRSAVVVGVVAASGAVASCSPATPLHVSVPTGDGTGCARLHQALPSDVGGGSARDVTPVSSRTAAWGSPAVVLRCGVARPAGLRCGSSTVEVNGVQWYLATRYPPYVFTTATRRTYVEVRVPSSVPGAQATGPLTALARALRRTDPVQARCSGGGPG